MPDRYWKVGFFLLLGLWGLYRYASQTQGDWDPQEYYVVAGRIFGRPTAVFSVTTPKEDPLYSQIEKNGGRMMARFSPQVPYRDFICEYPPLALVLFILPRLITDDLSSYFSLFGYEMAIFAITLWVLALLIARLLRPGEAAETIVTFWWAAWVWASGAVLVHRFDLAVVCFVALGVLAALRKNWIGSGAWLGLGIALKIYPVFLIVPLAAIAVRHDRWQALARFAIGIVLIPLLTHAALLPWTGTSVLRYFNYHSARGIEVETIWAQLILWFDNTGGSAITTVKEFGNQQLAGPVNLHPWIVASYIAMGLSNLACISIACCCIPKKAGETVRRVRTVALMLAAIGLTILSAKVLSLQYVYWLFPFAMVLPRKVGGILAAIYTSALIVARIYFPDYWPDVEHLLPTGMNLVLARNVLLIAMTIVALSVAMRWKDLPRGGSR